MFGAFFKFRRLFNYFQCIFSSTVNLHYPSISASIIVDINLFDDYGEEDNHRYAEAEAIDCSECHENGREHHLVHCKELSL